MQNVCYGSVTAKDLFHRRLALSYVFVLGLKFELYYFATCAVIGEFSDLQPSLDVTCGDEFRIQFFKGRFPLQPYRSEM